jgi:acyl-CoA thioesterase-1
MMAGSVEDEGMTFQMDRFTGILKSGLAALVMLLATTTPGSAQKSAQGSACRIAVLGDSLTAAYGVDVADGFPARLEQALQDKGYDCAVLDAGVSGDTSAGGLTRLDWMLADQPSHVIVELGGNDGLRGLPPEEMESNLDQIITRLQDQGIPVLLTGMLAPPNLGREYGDAFAAVFPALAQKHHVPLYPFFLDGVAGDVDLNQGDGIHPNAEGVEIIVERILPTVTNWLDATS